VSKGKELNKKKICFVTQHHWLYAMGGSEYQLKLLLDYLIEKRNKKYDFFYICRVLPNKFNSLGYKAIRICKSNLGIRKYGYFFDIFSLYKILIDLDLDIIYQRVGCAYTGVCAYYAKKFEKKMILHICNDKEAEVFKFRFGMKHLFKYIDRKFLQYGIKNASYIICQKKYQSSLLENNFNRQCDTIIANLHPKPENKLEKKRPIKVIWIANFKKIKRPELFLKLAEKFKSEKNVKFLMIGKKNKKKWQNKIEDKINRLDNLVYLGEQSIEEVNRILSFSHIFVNTSDYEGFPNTYTQAWLRQTPVVALNVDPDDLLERKRIGFYSRSFEQMVRDVKYLVDNEDIRKEMGKRARKYAVENYDIEKIGKRYLETFEEIIKD